MPYRRLPNTDQARVRALKAAVEKGDVYNVRDLAISLKTLFEARNFLQRFEAAQIYYTQCYENQSRASRKHQANVKTARLYISHFIQVLNLAVLRDEIKAVHKKLYDLPDANVVPDLLSEASGWRAIASIAEPPILPIPKPAPITARPAPIAAPNLLTPTAAAVACNNTDSNIIFSFKMVYFLVYLFALYSRLFRKSYVLRIHRILFFFIQFIDPLPSPLRLPVPVR